MEAEEVGFGDILQQAEQLNSEIDSNTELPRVHRNLRQVLEAGQQLLNRTIQDVSQVNAETKASVFLGSKGLDVSRFAEKLDPFYMTRGRIETVEAAGELDIERYLKNERKNVQLALVDRSSKQLLRQLEETVWETLESDWRSEKEDILSSITGSLRPVEFDLRQKSRLGGMKAEDVSLLSKTEVTYAHEIDNYNKAVIRGLPRPNLLERLQVAAKNSGDKNSEELWETVVSMVSNLPYDPTPTVVERRTSSKFVKALLSRAKKFLEKNFFLKLQQEVWSNVGKTQLGGSPAIIPLIKGFVTIKGIRSTPGLEEGPGDSGAIWAIIYYCIRCGRINDAINFMRDSIGPNEVLDMMEEYMRNDCEGLSKDQEYKVRLEYRRVLKNNCQDPYKRILYCILGACDVEDDHPEVISRLDDYLWLKLSQIREDAQSRFNSDFLTYEGFQHIISEKCGETYFDAFRQPLVYFEALFLTGQFEAAIEFLSRVASMKVHGIHVAIVLHELNFLLTTESKCLLTHIEGDPPGVKRINFCHLISKYAKVIQNNAPREALNYMYFLRNLNDEDGTNLFAVCVSELVMDNRDFNLLFGYISADGCRTPGLLESMGIAAAPIIEYCASESENNGLLEDAVTLYDLANKPDQALKVLIRLVALNVTKNPLPDSPRLRIQRLALSIAERYHKSPQNVINKSASSTFFILVDLMTFFDEYHAQRYENALLIIERMKIIPLYKEEIEPAVSNFHLYSDEIRMNIPDLIVATMEALHAKFKKLKAENKTSFIPSEGGHPEVQYLLDIKEKVRTIITYCGMIPYFMTSDVYSKLLHMEVQIG